MLISLALLLATSTSFAAANLADGKLLYEESCEKCHHSTYSSLGWNEMTNKDDLITMVSACSNYFQLDWNEQDIEDTMEYLNSEFFFLEK